MSDRELCPSGCGRNVRPGHLTCAPCWHEVPKHLQREVYAAWRALCKDITDENMHRYQDAKNAALASIR